MNDMTKIADDGLIQRVVSGLEGYGHSLGNAVGRFGPAPTAPKPYGLERVGNAVSGAAHSVGSAVSSRAQAVGSAVSGYAGGVRDTVVGHANTAKAHAMDSLRGVVSKLTHHSIHEAEAAGFHAPLAAHTENAMGALAAFIHHNPKSALAVTAAVAAGGIGGIGYGVYSHTKQAGILGDMWAYTKHGEGRRVGAQREAEAAEALRVNNAVDAAYANSAALRGHYNAGKAWVGEVPGRVGSTLRRGASSVYGAAHGAASSAYGAAHGVVNTGVENTLNAATGGMQRLHAWANPVAAPEGMSRESFSILEHANQAMQSGVEGVRHVIETHPRAFVAAAITGGIGLAAGGAYAYHHKQASEADTGFATPVGGKAEALARAMARVR